MTLHLSLSAAATGGKHDEAWQWLTDAFDLGDAAAVKLKALDDPDLEPFWAEIGEICISPMRAMCR
jgi:hypothetical protein